jgi:hypothetical protein
MVNTKSKYTKLLSIILIFSITLPFLCGSADAAETPEAVYSGISNANVMLKNISYQDINNSWAKEAIYETGALNIMKGYGAKRFGLNDTITKEQAIAMAYRLAGREADAQKAAETLDNARKQGDKKINPISMWSDGYLQLAANEGLISQQDLADALTTDLSSLTASSFHRSAPAQRQEMADWIAKTLKLAPIYDQQNIFNSYKDWQSADSIKIPYIEAILQNNIMNGDGKGNFKPRQSVTREQAAQIIKNAENLVLPLMGYDKKSGTIESIASTRDLSGKFGITNKVYNIRNINGKLHQINVSIPDTNSGTNKNEQNTKPIPDPGKDLIVYKNGQIGKSDMLKTGDRLEYVTAPDSTVKFARVISSIYDTKYMVAQLNTVDPNNLLMNVSQFFTLETPDIEQAKDYITFKPKGVSVNATYRYSNNASVSNDGTKSDINSLNPGAFVLLTIKNNIVTGIESFGPRQKKVVVQTEEPGVVQGIVEDSNPQLGYITLFNEDGTGTDPQNQTKLINFRTYNYTNPKDIEVYKDHNSASIQDVEEGDSVFLKLDDNGYVSAVSAVDNYAVKYGKVISKKPASLVVQYDNGPQQVLDIDSSIPVTADGKLSNYSRLKDGDRVKLLLHITNDFTKVKEIGIEGSEHFISNIYKGKVAYVDDASKKIIAQNLEVLDKGQWVRTDVKGFTPIRLADQYSMYSGDKELDINAANKNLKSSEAYIAVEKDYGGEERAVWVDFRNGDDAEALYDDNIAQVQPDSSGFSLSKELSSINLDPGTIVVKDGRLVTGNSLTQDDAAYVVANRSYTSGDYNAGVVKIDERPDPNTLQIYRGRISKINENSVFTLESFASLNGQSWQYYNTPKTLKITYDTRIVDDKGAVNQRSFIGYGTGSFVGQVVYVVAKDTDAVLVSTAPYGTYTAKGQVYGINGGITGDNGTVIQEPNQLNLRNAKVYDLTDYTWKDSKDMTIDILKNTVILKDNKLINPSDIKKDDIISIIKKDNSETGEGYIITVES